MSNRVQRFPKRNPNEQRWKARSVLIVFGAVLAAMGYEELHEGYLWTVRHNLMWGRVNFGPIPILGSMVMGVFFIILGVIPWP
jgi:hypothetical protein